MNVGLPYTGLGGIFYLVCAFFMLIVESVNTIKGRINSKRLGMAFTQSIMAAGILTTIWLTGIALNTIMPSENGILLPGNAVEVGYIKYSTLIVATPFLALAMLLCFATLLHIVVKIGKSVN